MLQVDIRLTIKEYSNGQILTDFPSTKTMEAEMLAQLETLVENLGFWVGLDREFGVNVALFNKVK
jgi:hypothetical protein